MLNNTLDEVLSPTRDTEQHSSLEEVFSPTRDTEQLTL